MRVILTNNDARRLERLIEEEPDIITVDITNVEMADTPVGEGKPAAIMTAGVMFHCRVQETPDPAKIVIEDMNGRVVEESPETG
jgi:hypothetical protein